MPYSCGGKAIGSPVFSDSSTRNTIGRTTRKATTSITTTEMIVCQFSFGLSASSDNKLKPGSAPGADDAVPFLGEARAVLLEGIPVGGYQQLHLREWNRTRRRRHVLTRRMKRQCLGERLLPDRREEPVHEQLSGVGMRTVGHDAVGFGHGRDAGCREDEADRRALGLELDSAGVLRTHDDLVLAVGQAIVLLDVGVEGAWLLGRELLEVVFAQDRLQHVPDAVL